MEILYVYSISWKGISYTARACKEKHTINKYKKIKWFHFKPRFYLIIMYDWMELNQDSELFLLLLLLPNLFTRHASFKQQYAGLQEECVHAVKNRKK